MLSQYSINHKRGEERRGSYPKGGAVLNFGGREGCLLKMALIRGGDANSRIYGIYPGIRCNLMNAELTES